MRPLVVLLAIAALAAAIPMAAFADPGDGHGRGGRWRDEGGPPGRSEGQPYGGGGRWGARDPPPDPGPGYGEPPRGRNSNSLGQYYRDQQDEAREGVRRGGNLPMGQVLESLRRRQPGRLLDAGIEQAADGRSVYRVRWAAADGRRIDYIIDARTGAILEAEGQ
jgi:hypothetical protein